MGAKNGKSGVKTGKVTGRVRPEHPESNQSAQAIEAKNARAEAKKKAKVRELPGLERKPRWASGTANLVERDGTKYLALTLDGCAFQVPNDKRTIAWLRSSLDALEKDKGEGEAREVEYPIAVNA